MDELLDLLDELYAQGWQYNFLRGVGTDYHVYLSSRDVRRKPIHVWDPDREQAVHRACQEAEGQKRYS